MAVDSQPKRFSMLDFAQLGLLLPAPDGTFGASDRIHLIGFYSGIQAAGDHRGLNVAASDRSHMNVAASDRNHMTVTVGDRQG